MTAHTSLLEAAFTDSDRTSRGGQRDHDRTRSPHPPSHSGTLIAIYAIAVLGLGWIGPLIDHTAGHGLGGGPGQLVWILLPIAAAMLLR